MLVLSLLLRTVIMALVSAIPLTAAQEIVDGTLKKLVENIRDENGLTTQEAKDIVFNILVDLALNAAIIGTVIKTKIAVKTAEYFGLTSRGLVKRTLTKSAAVAAEKIGTATAEKAVVSGLGIAKGFLLKGTNIFWLIAALAAIVEPGVYKPDQTNAVYRKLGIPFQYPSTPGAAQPGPFDANQFKDYASSLEISGVTGLNNPAAQQSQLYSRENLAQLIDYVYGQEVFKGNAPTAAKMIPLLAPYLIKPNQPYTYSPGGAGGVYGSGGAYSAPKTSSSPAPAQKPAPAPQVSQVKVFTGVVSNGILGAGLVFTPRADDLIENGEELQAAVANNLAPFLATLANRIAYEIKVTSTVTGRDGFKQYGQSQQIISGYYKDGSPKYKTVTNRFAVMSLYAVTDRGSRSKLTEIVLGPTDAARFSPSRDDLIRIENNITRNVVTTNTDDIRSIITETPTTVVPPATVDAEISKPSVGYCMIYDDYKGQICFNTATVDRLRVEIARGEKTLAVAMDELYGRMTGIGSDRGADGFANNNTNIVSTAWGIHRDLIEQLLTKGGSFVKEYVEHVDPPTQAPTQAPEEGENVSESAGVIPKSNASTLYEFYTELGLTLPSLAERAQLYGSLGLGQSVYYTGTAEQNTKLLNALKG